CRDEYVSPCRADGNSMKKITRRPPSAEPRFSNALHPVLQRVYAARGVLDDGAIVRSLRQLLSPLLLKGLPQAMELLVQALQQQQRILIVGDFDADGATSSALAVLEIGRASCRERVEGAASSGTRQVGVR